MSHQEEQEIITMTSDVTFPDRDDVNAGYLANLTPQQKAVLEALKAKMEKTEFAKELAANPDGDRFILRYLRATMKDKTGERVFDLNEGEKRLVEALNYRRKYKVDEEIRPNIENNTLPADYVRYLTDVRPRLILVEPRTGRVVQIERLGLLLTHTDVNTFSADDWMRFLVYDMETKLHMLREESKKRGYEVSHQIAIFDQKGVGIGSLERIPLFRELAHVAGIAYPELQGPVFVVNIHWLFSKGFKLVRAFLDPTTQSKLTVDTGVPVDKITAYISPEVLPREYGGKSEVVVGVPSQAKGLATG